MIEMVFLIIIGVLFNCHMATYGRSGSNSGKSIGILNWKMVKVENHESTKSIFVEN